MRPVSNEFPVSQQFGSDATAGVAPDPNGSEVQQLVAAYGNYQPLGHAGQDIACPIGTPVHAIASGTVIWADWGTNLPGDDSDSGYRQRWYMYKNFPGIVTLIQHDGWISMYGHLSNNDAAPVGTQVKEGQLIGLSGNTKAPGVTLGAHLHVGALVDLSYSCANGIIYGCVDPTPYYGTSTPGTISAQSSTITPLQEALVTPEQMATLVAEIRAQGTVTQQIADASRTHVQGLIDALNGNLVINRQQAEDIVAAVTARVPNATLNAQFKLADGTVTNLAGILAAINAKPVTVTNVTNAPAPLDPAAVAAAVLASLKTQITK